jgi:hypothetical protein
LIFKLLFSTFLTGFNQTSSSSFQFLIDPDHLSGCFAFASSYTLILASNIAWPIGENRDRSEKFADEFASELLMPRDYFNTEIKKVLKDGFVSLDDALKLSVQFGVSFTSCVFTLAYRYPSFS